MVVLDERSGHAERPVFVGVKRLEEEPTAVAMHVGLDDDHARQPGRNGPHYVARFMVRAPARADDRGTDHTRWPPSRARAWRDRPDRCSPCERRSPRCTPPSGPGVLQSREYSW